MGRFFADVPFALRQISGGLQGFLWGLSERSEERHCSTRVHLVFSRRSNDVHPELRSEKIGAVFQETCGLLFAVHVISTSCASAMVVSRNVQLPFLYSLSAWFRRKTTTSPTGT